MDKIFPLSDATALRVPGTEGTATIAEDGDLMIVGSTTWSLITTNPGMKRHIRQVVRTVSAAGGPTPLFHNILQAAKAEAKAEREHETPDALLELAPIVDPGARDPVQGATLSAAEEESRAEAERLKLAPPPPGEE